MSVAVTVTKLTRFAPEVAVAKVSVVFDNSYPTGGEVVDLSAFLTRIHVVVPMGPSTTGYVMKPIDAAGTQFVAGKFTAKAWYGDNNNAADGPLIEVPNTTDLSAETAEFLVLYAGM